MGIELLIELLIVIIVGLVFAYWRGIIHGDPDVENSIYILNHELRFLDKIENSIMDMRAKDGMEHDDLQDALFKLRCIFNKEEKKINLKKLTTN